LSFCSSKSGYNPAELKRHQVIPESFRYKTNISDGNTCASGKPENIVVLIKLKPQLKRGIMTKKETGKFLEGVQIICYKRNCFT